MFKIVPKKRRKVVTRIASKIAQASKYYQKIYREHNNDLNKVLFDKQALKSNSRLKHLKRKALRQYLAEVKDHLRAIQILENFCRSEKQYLEWEMSEMHFRIGK